MITEQRLEDLTTCEGSPLAVCVGTWRQYRTGGPLSMGSPFIDLTECDGSAELREALEALGFTGEDMGALFVQDAEGCLGELLKDCDNINPLELADTVKRLDAETKRECGESLRECGEDVAALMDATGLDIDEVGEELGNYRALDADKLEDAAWDVWDECGMLAEVPETVRFYIDFEQVGRDMEIEGVIVTNGERYFQYLG